MSLQTVGQTDGTRAVEPQHVVAASRQLPEREPRPPTGEVTYGSLLQRASCWPDAL